MEKTINKTVKDKIDNLQIKDEIIYNWEIYIVTLIEDTIELASKTKIWTFINVDYGELFDDWVQDEMETRANS